MCAACLLTRRAHARCRQVAHSVYGVTMQNRVSNLTMLSKEDALEFVTTLHTEEDGAAEGGAAAAVARRPAAAMEEDEEEEEYADPGAGEAESKG